MADVNSPAVAGGANMKSSDVMCPVCLSILVEPVTMPCSHSLCMPCFTQNVAQAALACPLCRLRISVWVRHATKSKRLVNTKLWQTIQAKFPAKVQARLQGEEDVDSEEIFTPVRHVSKPGEIRKEYEEMVALQDQEISHRRSQEEVASSSLIKKLQEEERERSRVQKEQKELEEQDAIVAQQIKEAEMMQLQKELERLQTMCANDEAVAREIEKTERQLRQHELRNKANVTPTRGPMDVYIGQMTPRTSGKHPVPSGSRHHDLGQSRLQATGSKQENCSPSLSQSDKPNMAFQLDTPHSSSSIPGIVSHNVGRQLREITSSQSSESDYDDSNFLRSSKHRHVTSGKENRSSKRRITENKQNKENSKTSYRTKNNSLKFSPDIDSYSGVRQIQEPLRDESSDSDETDAEDMIPETKRARPSISDDDSETEDTSKLVGKNGQRSGDASRDREDKNISTKIPENDFTDLTAALSDGENGEALALLVAEQKRIEERLKQEQEDHLLAKMLQSEMDRQRGMVNRSKGSVNEYGLRERRPRSYRLHGTWTPPKNSKESKRQTTLTESIQKLHKKT